MRNRRALEAMSHEELQLTIAELLELGELEAYQDDEGTERLVPRVEVPRAVGA